MLILIVGIYMAYNMPYGYRTCISFFIYYVYVYGRISIVFMTHVACRTRCPGGPHVGRMRPFAHPWGRLLLNLI